MKRFCIFALVLVYALSSFGFIYFDDEKYPYGRDTAVRVGEGRFDIFRTGFRNELYAVVDADTQDNIESNVNKYYDYKSIGKLYLIGENGYTVIDYEKTKTYEQHTDLDEFSEFDQKVFNNKWFDVPGRIPNAYVIAFITVVSIGTIFILFIVILLIKSAKKNKARRNI